MAIPIMVEAMAVAMVVATEEAMAGAMAGAMAEAMAEATAVMGVSFVHKFSTTKCDIKVALHLKFMIQTFLQTTN